METVMNREIEREEHYSKKVREKDRKREIALTLEEWSSLCSKGFRTEHIITLDTHTPAVDMPFTVVLDGPAPWGFRLIGGQDFSQPFTVAKVSEHLPV